MYALSDSDRSSSEETVVCEHVRHKLMRKHTGRQAPTLFCLWSCAVVFVDQTTLTRTPTPPPSAPTSILPESHTFPSPFLSGLTSSVDKIR